MKISKSFSRIWLGLLVLLVGVLLPGQTIYADTGDTLSQDDVTAIVKGLPWHDPNGGGGFCGSNSSGGVDLSGSDNPQKAFNYFKDTEGLTDVQAAGIVGNLLVESGVNPASTQNGGGPGRGIAQWSVDGRWANLLKYASAQSQDPQQLSTQLAFISQELHGTPPAGDYSKALSDLKSQTDVAGATESFMNDYEQPGDPHLDVRTKDAQAVLQKYGGGDGQAVSGTNAACGSAGAVDCSGSSAQAAQASNLSPLRQSVVCLAQAELALWDSGQMKPGTDFYKYTNNGNQDQQWCADFISYLYSQAGYPASDSGDHWIRAAFSFENAAKFDWHPNGNGYTPVPGDVAVHSYSHVNMVVSVDSNQKKITVIGGNQGGNVSGTGTDSKVSQYTVTGFAGDSIIGYASPKDTN